MERYSKKGKILLETTIFIIINVVFLSILILFLYSKTGAVAGLEEQYAKQIALTIDAAEPGMIISLNMEDTINKAKEEYHTESFSKLIKDYGDLVVISGNLVLVKFSEKSGYGYSFFNDVDVVVVAFDKGYKFTIKEKEEE